MTGVGMPSRLPADDAIMLLCAMQNLGITRREQASSIESLSSRVGLNLDRVRYALASLLADGYVEEVAGDGPRSYYVTARGILTAMSVFS